MPFKMNRALKGGELRTTFKLTLFDQVLSFCVGIWLLVLAVLLINPFKGSEKLLGNAWSFSNDAEAQIIDGTYGPEIADMEWLTGRPLKIQISNPQMKTIKVSLRIKLGASPCGTFPTVSNGIVLAKPNQAGFLVYQRVLVINPKSFKVLELTFEVSECQVPNDPRNFIGSIFQPSLIKL